MRPLTEVLGWLAFCLSLYLLVRCAQAADGPPCHHDGGNVVCTKAGFKVLTDKLIDGQTRARQCELALEDATSRTVECRHDCESLVPPVTVAPPKPQPVSALPAVSGASLVAISSAAVVLATVLSTWAPESRATLAVAGVTGLSLGVVLVLP